MDILLETPNIIVINKPAGLVVHADGRTDEPTVVDWILETYPEIAGVGEDWQRDDGTVIPRPGIVHRLDRDTSGALVIARTQTAFEHLKAQFQSRQVKKEYLAVCYGSLKADEGIIDAPIGKSKKDFRMWSSERGARGVLREAMTEYQIMERFRDKEGNDFSLVLFRPQTGRTHQIRVHAKHLGIPLVGDALYAGKNLKTGATGEVFALGFARQALHAWKVEFEDLAGERVEVEAPTPHGFEQFLDPKS